MPPDSVRRFAALFTAAAGLMNIVSALYPAVPGRVEILRDFLSLHFIRGSQTLTVLAGFFLILLADGLRKRRSRAMQATVALLILSLFLNLFKGLDFEEATASGLIALGLIYNRRCFDVPSRTPTPRRVCAHLVTYGLLFYCYDLSGFFILHRVVRPAPTLKEATLEPLRLLFGIPAFHYVSPQAQWFERSLSLVGCVAVLCAVIYLLRPLVRRHTTTAEERQRALTLLKQYGTDTLSYFSLQDGRSYFFDVRGEAFLSYRLWGNVALVAGDPVGPPDRIPALITSFREFARVNGMALCFLAVGPRYLGLYVNMGLRALKIGEEAVIDLPRFDRQLLKRKVRRAARHVADNEIRAVRYRHVDLPDHVRQQIVEVDQEWVALKGGEERGFSMTLGRLPRYSDPDCEFLVALQGEYVWGYLVLVPVYRRQSWSLDAMRRRAASPNGLMEFLVISACEAYRDDGFKELSLNFATLSNAEDNIASRMVEGTRSFLFEHLSSVYQLKSLQQFNEKFAPSWRSRYMAYEGILNLPRLAVAVVQAEDPVRLPHLVQLVRRQVMGSGRSQLGTPETELQVEAFTDG